MMYELRITEPVEKWIDKHLNRTLVKRLDNRIQKLAIGPDFYGKPLRGPLTGIWEIRFEKRYRILYKIDYQNKVVTIIGIKHKDEMS